MDFYTQILLQLVFGLGAAMVLGNFLAIIKRSKDREVAKESLRKQPRSSRQVSSVLARNQVKEGKATLAVAPLGRSIIFIVIGSVVMFWSGVTIIG